MANLGLFKAINPEKMNPEILLNALLSQLEQQQYQPNYELDMNGLIRVKNYIFLLLSQTVCERQISKLYQKPSSIPSLVINH